MFFSSETRNGNFLVCHSGAGFYVNEDFSKLLRWASVEECRRGLTWAGRTKSIDKKKIISTFESAWERKYRLLFMCIHESKTGNETYIESATAIYGLEDEMGFYQGHKAVTIYNEDNLCFGQLVDEFKKHDNTNLYHFKKWEDVNEYQLDLMARGQGFTNYISDRWEVNDPGREEYNKFEEETEGGYYKYDQHDQYFYPENTPVWKRSYDSRYPDNEREWVCVKE